MQKTTNYNLNQWDATDRVTRADVNADNAAIDAALAEKLHVELLTYTGVGTYGTSNPTRYCFTGRPVVFFVFSRRSWMTGMINPSPGQDGMGFPFQFTNSEKEYAPEMAYTVLNLDGNTVYFYSATTPERQFNTLGESYFVVGLCL